MTNQININERIYSGIPKSTAIVICLDGSQKEYFEEASKSNLTPNLDSLISSGENLLANSAIPSFTNPNNISIVTGRPSSVHGICGNFFYTPSTGEEVMMNDPQFLRAPTIFQKYYEQGAKIAIVTAKDKLRTLLSHGLNFIDSRAICFSSEKSDQATKNENGIENINEWLGMDVPDVYSQGLSEFVMAAGVKLLHEFKPDIMYLSTTDFIQHKYAPGDDVANKFYAMFDKYIGQLNINDNSIIITADHGMQPKSKADGSPNAIYLQDILDKKLGNDVSKVILPITDPYVVHHGALGSFATIYLKDKSKIDEAMEEIQKIQEIEVVVTNEVGCKDYDLPNDRMGDIICMTSKYMTIGSSERAHDLSKLKEPLRSHGGLHEREVPFISNKKINSFESNNKLNNYDAFYYAIAGAM
ncbi:MAG: phosphonoacetate hydrolase [Pelagibacteraceae bacterium]|nr:phosphonoacetate hydrolase [Pelagibacteraceae bacterium]